MAPSASKRSRRAAFHDDHDDGVLIAQASSSLRNENERKRVRISNSRDKRTTMTPHQPSSELSSGDEEEDRDVEDDAAGAISPPPSTQYEVMRDAGFRHLEHTDKDDQRATQRLFSRPTQLGDNHAAQNAIIESITCYNFMCHERLHCELGPLLNFIVGENGSGKSAILTAITLCLGGKASATNRGGSLRSFVKEGKDNALLQVKIKNQGVDAYKPDIFGHSIIVERSFNKSGTSGFRLKSESERLISNKKSDVDDVVDYFCLQVDNPLNVLSQDNARQFLNAATPATKYKYFVQGTQLEQLSNDYQLLQEYLESTETKLIQYDENIAVLKEQYEKAVKLRETVGKNAELRDRRVLYRNQLAWAQVVAQEDVLRDKEAAITAAEDDIQNMAHEIEAKAHAYDALEHRVQQALEAFEQVVQERNDVQQAEQEAKEKFDAAKKALTVAHTQERDIHSQVQAAAENVQRYQQDLAQENQRLEEINGGAVTEKQREVDDAQRAASSLENSTEEHRQRRQSLDDELKNAKEQERQAAELVEQKRKDVSAADARLRAMSQKKPDPLAGYEPQMPQLLKLIDNDREFSKKPIGPVGSMIQLLKPEWSGILEKTLGQTLSGFIVASFNDQRRLQSHISRLKMTNCPVMIASNSRIQQPREPDPKFDTILRVLNIDDPVVRDQLIISSHIEQTILIKDRVEAQHVMWDGRPPENVSACLAFNEGKRGQGLRLTNRTNIGSAPVVPNFNQKPRMKSDIEMQIHFHRESLRQLQSDMGELQRSREQATRVTGRCSQAVMQHERDSKRLANELRRARVAVQNLEDELEAFNGTDGKIGEIQELLEDAKKEQEHYGNQYGEFVVLKTDMNKKTEEARKELGDAKRYAQDFSTKLAKYENKLRRQEEAKRIALVEKNEAHEKEELARIRKDSAERSRDVQAEVVQEHIEGASQICTPRVCIPEGETVQAIERKFMSITEQLQKIRSQLGASDEAINDRAAEATRQYREAKKTAKNLGSLVTDLKQALMTRLDKWRQFQRLISAHARANFAYLLSERSFQGQLLLDHQQRKLEVQVEPDQTRKNASGRNTKTLSGGEKSFSSICLLLAIWDAMGSPLRCLDEFDVFMDNVNRAISTNMLTNAARRSVGKQFILITPNAIEGRATLDKDVKIIRLTDPRQRTLIDH